MSKLLTRLSSKVYFQVFKGASQAGLLMCGGDLLSQLAIEKKNPNELDTKRTLRFGLIGFAIVGPSLFKWYGFLERRIKFLHPGTTAMAKMLADQFTFAPIFLYGFFWVNGGLQGLSVKEIKTNVGNNYWDVLKANYQLWPAAQMINFWLIPLSQRILFAQTVALFWNTYLAWKVNRSKDKDEDEETEGVAVVVVDDEKTRRVPL